MTDSDFNLIVPVENLQSIQALTSTGERQERKRRQKTTEQHEPDEEPQKQTPQEQAPKPSDGSHAIDYCA